MEQVTELMNNAKIEEDKIKDMRFQVNAMTMELDDVEWNSLIPVGNSSLGLQDVLTITPAKKYDFTQPTGLTPAITGLLPSPHLSGIFLND